VAASPQEPTVFFTGKPYVDGLGYVFKYRNYNPELCRWQSADPSGFPDGANNQIYVNNKVTSALDPTGCEEVDFTGSASYSIPGTQITLSPSESGVITYTLNDSGKHFASGPSGKWVGPKSGTWAYTDLKTNNSYTFTEDVIKKTASGISGDPTNSSLKRDYVTMTAYLELTTIINGLTTYTPYVANTTTVYGNWYE